MQQIGMTGRFWWRALDAPMPRPAVSHASNHLAAPGAWTYPARGSAKTAGSRNAQKLSIPRDQRRRSQNRSAKRAGNLAMFTVAATLASAAAGVLVLSGKLEHVNADLALASHASQALMALGFGIDQVSISGHHYTPDADIYDALDLPNTKTFAELDAAAALKRIERLPWVDSAQITRVFPGALAVQIRERQPAAIWSRADKNYLIDATGRVLGLIASRTTWQLPRIAGEGANNEAAMLFTALGRYPALEKNYDRGERIAERRWSVVLKNGSRVELGADREAEGLELVQAHGDLRRALEGPAVVVDVRTPGRPVIRTLTLAEGTATARPVAEARP